MPKKDLRTGLPYGTFVVFGIDREPSVIALDARSIRMLADREAVADRLKAITATFGTGAEYALPAWSKPCMELIACEYVGPHQRMVRGLCAAIALNQPFNPDPEDGPRVEPKRPKPTPRGPAGAKAYAKPQRTTA